MKKKILLVLLIVALTIMNIILLKNQLDQRKANNSNYKIISIESNNQY